MPTLISRFFRQLTWYELDIVTGLGSEPLGAFPKNNRTPHSAQHI
jgi:hypothetical protein